LGVQEERKEEQVKVAKKEEKKKNQNKFVSHITLGFSLVIASIYRCVAIPLFR